MKNFKKLMLKIIITFFIPTLSWASTTGVNSWKKTLYSLSLTSPVAYAISLISIVACGLAMAFSDLQGGAKRFIQAACRLSIAFFSTQIITGFIGFSGAVV